MGPSISSSSDSARSANGNWRFLTNALRKIRTSTDVEVPISSLTFLARLSSALSTRQRNVSVMPQLCHIYGRRQESKLTLTEEGCWMKCVSERASEPLHARGLDSAARGALPSGPCPLRRRGRMILLLARTFPDLASAALLVALLAPVAVVAGRAAGKRGDPVVAVTAGVGESSATVGVEPGGLWFVASNSSQRVRTVSCSSSEVWTWGISLGFVPT